MKSNNLISGIPIKNISKLNFHNILYKSKRKVNFTKIIKRKSISRSSAKNLSFNNIKKNHSSSIDYNETPLKKNMNISLSNNNLDPLSNITISFKPKEIMPKSTKLFEINNYNFKNEKIDKNYIFSKVDINRTKKIKTISFNLETSLNQLKINEEKDVNLLLYKKYLAYFIALEDYIKLISSNDEKNLLNNIKLGIDNLFNIMGKINQKLLIQNSRIKRENELKNPLINEIKINESTKLKNSSFKKNKKKNKENNDLNDSYTLNKNEKKSDESNLSFSDLDSIRFNDKIKMKRINSFDSIHSIPKLNLKFFNSLSTKNFIVLKENNNPKHKKDKIQYIFNQNCFPVI